MIGEVQRASADEDPSWSLTLGGWMHFDRFPDLAPSATRILLADPRTAIPLKRSRDFAAYAIGDARLWRSDGRTLHGFLRATLSPSDRNAIDLYADAGLALTGSIPARPNDILGLGVAVARLSPRLHALRADACVHAAKSCHTPPTEIVVEASYQLQMSGRLHVQPNVQFVLHPSSGLIAEPEMPGTSTADALVFGLRTSLRL